MEQLLLVLAVAVLLAARLPGGGKAMSAYWQALCSGLEADGETFSDVDEG